MPHEKRNDDTLKVLIALEGRDPEVVTDFAELERRVAAALADPIRFKDHHSVLVDSPLPPYLPLDVEVSMRALRERSIYGMPVKKIRGAIAPPVRRRPQIVMGCGAALGPGKTSDFLSGFTVDVPLYAITVSEAMIDAAERVLTQHVLLAWRRRARIVSTFVRGFTRTGRVVEEPRLVGEVWGRFRCDEGTPQTSPKAPRNPSKTGG